MKSFFHAVVSTGLVMASASSAAAQPTINNNFVAQVTLSQQRETGLQLLNQSPILFARNGSQAATVYVWHEGQMRRADFTNPDTSVEQVFQYWNSPPSPTCSPTITLSAPTQFNYSPATDTCTQTALTQPYRGLFDFVPSLGQNGTCSVNTPSGSPIGARSGSFWRNQPTGLGMCANGNTPIAVRWGALKANPSPDLPGPDYEMYFDFGFTPGVPDPSNFCLPTACATTAPTHDSVVLGAAPKLAKVTIRKGASSASKTLRVRVGNGAPGEKPGHTIQLTVGGDCPDGTVVGVPDFDKAAAGSPDTAVVAGGRPRTARVSLHIDSAAFTTFNAKSPRRCTLIFTAKTVEPTTWFEPTPENNTIAVELNVTDKNDPGQSTKHESVLQSIAPVRVGLSRGKASRTKGTKVTVVNADILPTPEKPGDVITVTASDGDCPTGTVGMVDFKGQNSVTLAGGAKESGQLALTIDAAAFTSPSAASPARCTAELTATGPSVTDPDVTNNRTKLVINVVDKNDF